MFNLITELCDYLKRTRTIRRRKVGMIITIICYLLKRLNRISVLVDTLPCELHLVYVAVHHVHHCPHVTVVSVESSGDITFTTMLHPVIACDLIAL